MKRYAVTRTGQRPLLFQGEEIVGVYGEWANGLLWLQYHNLTVYRTADNRYVLSIQYRTGCATIHEIEQPHDYAVMVADTNALRDEVARYDPLAYQLHRPLDGQDHNNLRRRYQEQVQTHLRLVQHVREGAPPPLYEPVVIEWGEIDDDVRTQLAEDGAPEGIGGPEVLRRSVQCEMEAIAEGLPHVVVVGADAPDGDDMEADTIFPRPDPGCVDCGVQHLSVFFTAPTLGI
jgi:hypothetical protein